MPPAILQYGPAVNLPRLAAYLMGMRPLASAVFLALLLGTGLSAQAPQAPTTPALAQPATMETGITVQVPPFINKGEKIKIDTTQGTYMERG